MDFTEAVEDAVAIVHATGDQDVRALAYSQLW